MPEVTSPSVASDAGTLLGLDHLTDEHLPMVKRVAGSCLTQHEPKQDTLDAMQAYLDMAELIVSFQRQASALMERMIAPIAPPKP
jgi:hypothetical protein